MTLASLKSLPAVAAGGTALAVFLVFAAGAWLIVAGIPGIAGVAFLEWDRLKLRLVKAPAQGGRGVR